MPADPSSEDRIFFAGNPWPEGHPVATFDWTAEIRGDDIWCHFHLKSAEYYAERDIEEDEFDEDGNYMDVEYGSDWDAPGVWGNYHACTMSSTYWGHAGFRLCDAKDYAPEKLDGLELSVDPVPDISEDVYHLAFGIYLLGHDACGDHKIRFERIGDTDRVNIYWSGKIAMAYVGDDEFKYEFRTVLTDIGLPELNQPEKIEEPQPISKKKTFWQRLFGLGA